MTEDPESKINSGRLIVKYLQQSKNGATITDVVQHICAEQGNEAVNDVNQLVTSILESGTAMGFLERKGSRFLNWMARETCGRRRRRSCCRRRCRRRIRRRCSRRRRRRCRCG